MKGRLRFTSEGLAWFATTAVLGLLGWLKSLNLLLLLAYMMLGLLVMNGLLARSQVRRVRAKRLPVPPVFAGETVRVAVRIQHDSAWAATISVQDGFTQWNVETLAPGGSIECTDIRSYPNRGVIAAPPILVASASPFGFLRCECSESAAGAIAVLPALGQADADGLRHWFFKQAGTEGRSRKVLRRITTDLADVRGVRPYRSGDSIRAIHWRSSARRRELMVREYDTAPSPDLLVVVEPWLPPEPTEADRARLEAALSLAATMIHAWGRSIETRVGLVVAGAAPVVCTSAPSDARIRELLTPLAGIEGTSAFGDIPGASWAQIPAKSARVVVSSRTGSPLAVSLGRTLGKPFIAVDPSQPLSWYQPPPVERV